MFKRADPRGEYLEVEGGVRPPLLIKKNAQP